MSRTVLYRLRGFDLANFVVWGRTVWAVDAADARALALEMIAKDRVTEAAYALPPLAIVAHVKATKGGSPRDAVNHYGSVTGVCDD